LGEIGLALTSAKRERATDPATQWIAKASPFLADAAKVFRCPDDFAAPSSASSYGLNSRTMRFSVGDGEKIVVLEYKQAIANVVGPQGSDDWNDLVAPRHRGSLFTLVADGGVHRRTPVEIDPTNCEIHDRLWRPTAESSIMLKANCERFTSVAPAAGATSTGAAATTTGGTTASTAATTAGTTTTGGSGATTTTTTTGAATTGTTSGTTTGSPPPGDCFGHVAFAGCVPTRVKWVRVKSGEILGYGGATHKLILPEVEVWSDANVNIALGKPSQMTSTNSGLNVYFGTVTPDRANNGNTNQYMGCTNPGQGCDFAHSLDDPYATPICWEVALQPPLNSITELNRIKYYNCGPYQAWWCSGVYVEVLGECGNVLFTANVDQSSQNNTLAYATWQFNLP
jgi:hypothetical protein